MKHFELWRKAAGRAYSPDTLFPFLITSIALAFLGDALLRIVMNVLGETTDRMLAVAAGAAMIILGMLLWSRILLTRRPESSGILPNKEQPVPHRGLIFMISRPEPCERAFQHHQTKLEQVWLICSDQSRDVSRQLQDRLKALKPGLTVEICTINDVNDPLTFYDGVCRIYRNLPAGWTPDDVIADYVGMTAHGSVGMVMACVKNHWPFEYTPAEFDHELKAIKPLAPIRIHPKRHQGLRP